MAIFDPLVSSLEFAQTSYEDYMKPYAMQEALYQERRKASSSSGASAGPSPHSLW